ncbi:MAG: hypothetical protein HY236_09040 [Acidobacteria bacterium]|nr:hypothetical protein [Acidobacteriota bacterium]
MSSPMGYLEQYSEAETRQERLEKVLKRTVVTLLVASALGGFLYLWFKNYKEEKRVEQFLATLERGDYPAAYTFWGCRVEAPCPNYDFRSFLEDWGPASPVGKLRTYRLVRSRERGSGVVVTIVANNQPEIKLWVEKKNEILGFSPL